MWAGLDDPALEERLARAPFRAYTSQTLTSAEQLRAAVVSVRELGYATAQEQLECGIVAIAVPVRDPSRRVIASINCSSELARNDLQTLVATRLAPLRETAAQIEQALERFPALAHAIGASYG